MAQPENPTVTRRRERRKLILNRVGLGLGVAFLVGIFIATWIPEWRAERQARVQREAWVAETKATEENLRRTFREFNAREAAQKLAASQRKAERQPK